MQLVVQSGSEPGRTYDITTSQKIRMGRQSGNDVVVPDEQVSRRHAEIEERNGGLVVTDLGSSNGTFVNGTRIATTQNLKAGDTVQVGTTVLKVVGSAAPAATDYDQGATQVNNYGAGNQDYGSYGSPSAPSAPSAPANDYGQQNSYGQSSSPSYGGSSSPAGSSSYDQGQNNYGGSGSGQSSYGGSSAGSSPAGGSAYGGSSGQSSYGGSSSGSSYDQAGQGQNAYGGSSAGGSSYGGSSSPAGGSSYDQGQNSYGGSSAGGSSYGGAAQSGSSYDQAGQGQSAGGYGQQNSYGQSSTPSYGQSGASYDPANPSGSGANAYGGSSYDPANPSAGGYSASGQGQQGGYDQNAYGGQQQGGYNQGQYGQPGQQYGQPGGYAQPGAPAVAAKKGGLPLPLLIVGIVVVLVVVGALVFFLFLNKGGGAVGDVPAPPNSTKLEVSANDLVKLDPNSKVTANDISKVNFGIYTSTDTPATITTFYTTEMKNRGWTQDTAKSSSSSLQFTKGDQTAEISVVAIPDDATATALASALPVLKDKVKAGQTIVSAASGPTNIVNGTPGS